MIGARVGTRALTVTAALVALSLASGGAIAEPRRVGLPRFEGQREALVRNEVMKAVERQGYSADGSVKREATFSAADRGVTLLASAGRRGRRKRGSGRTMETRKGAESAPAAAEADRTPENAENADGDSGDKASPTASKEEEGGSVDEDAAGRRSRSRRTPSSSSREDPDADVAATAEADETAAPTGRWLELALGARTFSRTLTYHQVVTPTLRQHQVVGPAGVLDVAFYPLALTMAGPAANIGVVAHFEQAFSTTSHLDPDGRFPSGASFPTSMQELSGGLRVRIPWASGQFGATVTAGQHALWFTDGTGVDRAQLEIPNAIYRFARGGLDASITVTPQFSLGAGAGYRFVFNDAGQFGDIFPHLTVSGVDAEVRASYAITRTIEGRVQAMACRYFFDMHSVAADATIAGGAVDQYLSLGAQLVVTLDRAPP